MVSIKLVVLGSSGTYPRPGGACNSYLINADGGSLLIDLGPGSLSRLFTWQNPADISGIFISHLHPDHFLDIYPYRYYLQFSVAKEKLPLQIYAPAAAKEKIAPVFSDQNTAGFDQVFSWHDLKDGESIEVGPFNVTPFEVYHLKPTFSLSIETFEGGGRIYYTADTGYDHRLVDLAKGADLFLCEASLRREDAGKIAHLTGSQAGEIAREAGVGHLVLTHLWPHHDSEEILADAKSEFSGQADLATDGAVFEIT